MKTLAVADEFGRMTNWRFSGPQPQGASPESASPIGHEGGKGEICIANISPRERLKRLIGGVIPFVIALGALAWMISVDADRLWRLPLFLLFVAAGSGFFQWRDKT
jgi:hypothetical protein